MKYILDFDEVLFNTDALKEKMEEMGIPETQRGPDVFGAILEKDPHFKMEDLVFPNVWDFLQTHGNDCIIVSSASSSKAENNTDEKAQKEFQAKKIFLSGVEKFGADVRVVGVVKTEALKEVQNEYGEEELIFLDDREPYVREAKALGIKSIWMDREGKGHLANFEGTPAMLEFPRVGNFAEFVRYIESCEKILE